MKNSKRRNIYWITGHFLTATAEFERLGVDWRKFAIGRQSGVADLYDNSSEPQGS